MNANTAQGCRGTYRNKSPNDFAFVLGSGACIHLQGSLQLQLFISNTLYTLFFYLPAHVLIATCVWLPIVVALAVASRTRETLRTTVCAWATSIGTSEGLTQIFKIYVRRRRPNFMDLCGYETGQCTNSDDHIIEANLSFPSGHSSLSACGMTFLTLAVLSQLLFMQHQRVSKQSSSLQLRWYAPLVTLAAFTYTLFVGTSRIVDYWHFPSDVLAGWCLGGLTSAACFHIWFPPLWHERVGMPWSSLLSPSRRMIPDVSPPSGSLMIPLGSFVKEESLQE